MISESTKKTQLLTVITLGLASQCACYYFDLGVAIYVCNLITSCSATFGILQQQTAQRLNIGDDCDLRKPGYDGTSKR